MKPVSLVLVLGFTALGGCKPVTTEEIAGHCEMKAEQAFANSPLTDWEREKAKGVFANVCMRNAGYARNEDAVRSLCAQSGQRGGPGDTYWRMDSDCWTRKR